MSGPMRGRLKQTMAAGVLLAVSASGCSGQPHPTTSITVYASSAMVKSLTAIGKQFEAENPGTSVEFIFASSSALSAQLAVGTGADVFVSGDHDNMAAVANAGLVDSTPLPIATNDLVIATAPGNRDHLASFSDLARPGVRVAVCGAPGACGSATRQLQARTGVRLNPQNVDTTGVDVLKDVTRGKVDAGLVFKTDALNAGDNVSWFEFPESADATVTSWIATLKDSDQAELATNFVQDVSGPTGRKIFADDGFAEPNSKLAG
jgi:molybdate transport system substrate-binding protein